MMGDNAIPQTAREAQLFLWHAMKYLHNQSFNPSPLRPLAHTCIVLRKAILQLHAQARHEELIERIRQLVPGFIE